MPKIYAVTATEINDTGKISFKFMFDSKSPYPTYSSLASNWGMVLMKDKDENEVNPWILARALFEPDRDKKLALTEKSIGPDGIMIWVLHIFSSKGLVLTGSANDNAENEGLKSLLKAVTHDCVLLMHRGLFDEFSKACEELGIELNAFHFDGVLSSS